MADYDSFYRLLIRSMTTGYPFLCNWQAIPIYRYLSGLICPEKSTSSMTFVKISTRNGFVKYEAKQSLASLKCTRWWVRTQKMIFETYNWCVEEPECICPPVRLLWLWRPLHSSRVYSKGIPRSVLQRLALLLFFWLLSLTSRLPCPFLGYRALKSQLYPSLVARWSIFFDWN